MKSVALLAVFALGAYVSAGTLFGVSRDGAIAHRLVSIDTATGGATTLFRFSLPTPAFSSAYLTYNPVRDRFLMTAFLSNNNSYLVEIDPNAQSASQASTAVPSSFFEGIQYSTGHGGLVVSYGANTFSGNLALLNGATYGLTSSTTALGLADGDSLSLDASGQLNVLDTNNPTAGFQRNRIVDPFGTPTVTGVGANIFSTGTYELEYDPSLATTFANTSSTLYSVDAASTTVTSIGAFGGGYNIVGLAVVPEPATLAGLALGALALMRRKRS